ncbi:MAG: aminotransferase class I/II-fold pyridoxal phosphate-dependent enzyme [Nitrospirae bacterium]|nr:aminotransferase class I/II-fold pyridoxal phosphate-dependent enzyme [Nitrospirota bacterium]
MTDRLEHIKPFMAMDIAREAQRFPDTIHMELGEPDIPPSPGVTEAYVKAIRDGKYAYTPALGLMELREKIAAFYGTKYGIDIPPSRVIVTPGTSGALMVALGLSLDAGDRLCLPEPSYPCYRNFASFLNIDPVFLPAGKDKGFELTADMLRHVKLARGTIVSSPANPTGKLYGQDNLAEIADFCRQRKIALISDEIYHGLVYEKREHTVLEFSEEAIVINGFSKAFCMPGLRVGWMIVPERLVRKAEIIVQNIFIAANTPAQYAACNAFDTAYMRFINETFKHRLDYLSGELSGILDVPSPPDGAFYVWADISGYLPNDSPGRSPENSPGSPPGSLIDSLSFCRELLNHSRVAITPGMDFGSNATEKYVRFSCTSPMEILESGIGKIKAFLRDKYRRS